MNAIRIRKRVDSDTLHIPELQPFLGRTVEIIVLDDMPTVLAGTGDWDAAMEAVRSLEDYDCDAYRRQREYDLKHAQDHLR